MTEEQFANVKIGDIVFLDFTKYNSTIKSITGKVIDIGKINNSSWALVYTLYDDDSWRCSRWNCAFITSIVESHEDDGDPIRLEEENVKLKQENESIKSKIQGLIIQMMEAIK